MKGLRTLFRLPSATKALALGTLMLVACVRAGLFVVPLKRLQHLLRIVKPIRLSRDTPVRDLVWAVRAAAKRVPMATCLTQSLALQFLMEQSGRQAQVRIGVRKDSKKDFQSHAWVEYEGSPLLSEPDEIEQYSPMLLIEQEP